MTHYCPAAGLDEFRESIAAVLQPHARRRRRGEELPRRHRREAVPLLHGARLLQPRRRGDLPRPRLPDLRVGDSLGRRGAGAAGAARGRGLLARPRTARGAALAAHEARHPQLPAEPDGRHARPRRRRGGRRGSRDGRQAWILADEIYSQLQYDEPFASVTSFGSLLERTLVLDGLSKTYAMTGWRCGFAAVPEPLVEPLVRFFVNSTSCVPPFVQLAGIAALEGPQDAVADDGRGVPAPAAHRRRRPERASRRSLHRARGRLLRVPERRGRAALGRRARPAPARRGGCRDARGLRVRPLRRRPSADQLRELGGQPARGARADGRVPRRRSSPRRARRACAARGRLRRG